MSIKSSAPTKQSVCNNRNSQFSREQKKVKVKEKTKSWCQLKRLHAELPPQSQHYVKFCLLKLELN